MFDIAIIGGGPAGLAAAILFAKNNQKVLLIEKGNYPRHKVCGEYISNESKTFLTSLGINFNALTLPNIDILKLKSKSGNVFSTNLQSGGFGWSRYEMENALFELLRNYQAEIMTDTKFLSYEKKANTFIVKTNKGDFETRFLIAANGKLAHPSFENYHSKLNWLGIKYHLRNDMPDNEIHLHSFDGGYAGMSKIENNKTCFCYLTHKNQLINNNKSIKTMEKNVLFKNKCIANIFSQSVKILEEPIVISNISFHKKVAIQDGVFYIGDAAGSIAPLSGNGMSNAFRSAKMLFEVLEAYFSKNQRIEQCYKNYQSQWNQAFSKRISDGGKLQQIMCKPFLFNTSILFFATFPFLAKVAIRRTHGKEI